MLGSKKKQKLKFIFFDQGSPVSGELVPTLVKQMWFSYALGHVTVPELLSTRSAWEYFLSKDSNQIVTPSPNTTGRMCVPLGSTVRPLTKSLVARCVDR